MCRETTNDANRQLPVAEDFVVECNKEAADVVGLRQMSVKLLVQMLKDGPSNGRS